MNQFAELFDFFSNDGNYVHRDKVLDVIEDTLRLNLFDSNMAAYAQSIAKLIIELVFANHEMVTQEMFRQGCGKLLNAVRADPAMFTSRTDVTSEDLVGAVWFGCLGVFELLKKVTLGEVLLKMKTTPEKEGYLFKQFSGIKWSQHWVVLKNGFMYYYHKRIEPNERLSPNQITRVVSLAQCQVKFLGDVGKYSFCFEVMFALSLARAFSFIL